MALGRSLRRARVSQGLGVHDASRRAGLTFAQIEMLEAGDPGHLPNQVDTVNLLRRYAAALGLPADTYALALLDAWPTRRVAGEPSTSITSRVPARTAATGARAEATRRASSGAAKSETLTGVVPAQPARTEAAETNGTARLTAQIPLLTADTGPVEAVSAPEGPRRRGPHNLALLRVLVALFAVLVLLGAAALAIHHWKPEWFHSLEHRNNSANTSATATHAPKAPPGSVSLVSSGPNGAVVSVQGNAPLLRVGAVGGTSWTEVTQAGSTTGPLFADDLASGQSRDFPLTAPVSVQFGASTGQVQVLVHGQVIQTYHPPTAPYTVTFRAA